MKIYRRAAALILMLAMVLSWAGTAPAEEGPGPEIPVSAKTAVSGKKTVKAGKITIVTQPKNVTAASGETVKFSVEAQGEDLTYQWEYLNDSNKWKAAGGASGKTATMTVKAKISLDGRRYRCRITNGAGNHVYSKKVRLRIGPAIKEQPEDVTAGSGDTVTLQVKATGVDLKYQWEYREADAEKADAWIRAKEPSAKENAYTFEAKKKYNGRVYRCVVTAGNGTGSVTSREAALTIAVLPQSITLDQTELELTVEDTWTLKATVLPKDAEDTDVTWTSSDPAVVGVENGELTAYAAGTAEITAATVNGLTAVCRVTVAERTPPEYATFAVIGDSYSTFRGWLRESGAPYYYPRLDVTSVEQTWWYMFGKEYGSKLIANNSWSTRTISHDGMGEGTDDFHDHSFTSACKNIGNPDLILLLGGINDYWFGVEMGDYKSSGWTEEDLQTFRGALGYTLCYLKNHHRSSRIVFLINTGIGTDYVTSIRSICAKYRVGVVMLSNIDKAGGQYLHPTAAGMIAIKDQLIAYLSK